MVEDAVNSIKNTSTPCRLEPMPASMRKMVHNLVKASYPGMETTSEGEGRWRKVVIRRTDSAPSAVATAPETKPEPAPVAEMPAAAAVQPAAEQPAVEQPAAVAAQPAAEQPAQEQTASEPK